MPHQPSVPLTADDLKSNLGDIQGGLLNEYDTLACRYIFYRIDDAAKARTWLQELADDVTPEARPAD